MYRIALLLFACCWVFVAKGTHLLGGEMHYDALPNNSYRITLRLYRDCGPGNTNGVGFDAQAQLAVYDGNGTFQFSESVDFPGEQPVEVDLNNPCLAAPATICAQWTDYVTIITLPPNTTGYVVSYQRCCRTPITINLPNGLLQGLTCTVEIPPAATGTNSGPRFSDYPPLALCVGQDMVFDHSATDPDGDVLVYDLITPFNGGSDFDPAPLAGPPPYTPILWAPGYSGTDPMDGAPGLAIDAATGELTVHPTVAGSFAVGIRVREFRNGVQLSQCIRDFRFDAVPCEVTIISSIQDQQEFCSGFTVFLENESFNGDFWHWDFGDPTTSADTSGLAEPQWTYSAPGIYEITLVANPGWPCADTSTSTFEVRLPLAPSFVRPAVLCPDVSTTLEASGSFTAAASVVWEFGDVASPGTSVGPMAIVAFTQPGNHPVQLTVSEFGCEAVHVDTVFVFPRIVATAESERSGCVGVEFAFTGAAQAWSPLGYRWDFGDGTTTSEPLTAHAYSDAGTYDVVFTAFTTEGCVDERTIVLPDQIEVFPIPIAQFTVEPDEVSLLRPEISIQDHAQLAQEWSYVIEGINYTVPSFVHTFEEAGQYAITQVVTSGDNCTAEITRIVNVTDHLFYAPNAFTPDGDGLNDTFAPSVRGARLYEIVIVDRWGREHFRSNDPRAEWDGGNLPQGVYAYTVRLAEFGAYRKEYTGHVTLLR